MCVRQRGGEQLGHTVDEARGDASQRRSVGEVLRDDAHAQLGERRRHLRLQAVVIVQTGQIKLLHLGGVAVLPTASIVCAQAHGGCQASAPPHFSTR